MTAVLSAGEPRPHHLDIARRTLATRVRHVATAAAMIALLFWLPLAILSEPLLGTNTQPFRSVLVDIAIFSIAALGLNILVGYTGLLNLGFAGFMCIGAYTAAILMKEYSWNYFPACLAAVLHAAMWGILLGLPTLHLTGDYFAIVTFGFGELVILAARNNLFGMTGGTRGYPDVPPATLDLSFLPAAAQRLGLMADVDPETWRLVTQVREKSHDWFFACLWLVAVILVVRALSRSRLGRAWRAIHADELAAMSCGINTRWYKTLAFMVAAGLGGLAGAIQAVHLRNVAWNNFLFLTSVYVLVYLVLGGMGTIAGVILGTTLLVSSLEVLRWLLGDYLPGAHPSLKDWVFLPDLRFLVYGLILVVFIRYRPEGLVPSSRIARELHPSDLERHHEDIGYADIRAERALPEPNTGG